MYAKVILYFIVACNLGSINLAQDEARCDYLGTGLYEDIGCKAVYGLKKSCPDRYLCPTNKNDPNICYQGGNKYNKGENINLKQESCMNCTCKSGYKQSHIICEYQQCPPTPTPKEGCYYISKPFECCATKEHCESQNPIKCEYNGQVYSDGQYFRPANTCLGCYCFKGFEGKLEEPYCKRITNLADIYNQREISKRCAPNYYVEENRKDESLCYTSSFICEEDIIKATYIRRGAKTKEEKCAFNGGFYNKEDYLNVSYTKATTEEFATCSCRLPPLMTCITTYPYLIRYDDEAKERNRNNPKSKKDRSNQISKIDTNNQISNNVNKY